LNRGRGSYEDFDASELYCGKCGQSVPVVKKLLLVLPDGEKYDYICAKCGTPIGEKMVKKGPVKSLVRR